MPGFKVNERAEEIEAISCSQGYNDVAERFIVFYETARWVSLLKHRFKVEKLLGEILPPGDSVWNSEVNGISGTPYCDNIAQSEQHHADGVRPFRTLRSISERTNQDNKDETDVQLEVVNVNNQIPNNILNVPSKKPQIQSFLHRC